MELVAYFDALTGLWRVDKVPIISTGIEYPLASGPKTFTEDELSDAVLAIGDPAIKGPRVKLGHSSEYNAALVGDAEQAFGRVENVELGNFGQTIYGDFVGLPEWLAKVLPIAYPNRSIEGDGNVSTNTGKQYRLVISAVSLLGVRWPGCSTLEDLPLYYGADVPPGVEIDNALSIAASDGNGGGVKPGDRIRASVDIDLIERAFYTNVAQDEQYWWWIRAERYDDSTGLQLIVDCDDGTLARIPVSVNGSDVEFGEPVEVTEEYPDKSPVMAAAFVAGMANSERTRGADVVVYASRADTTQDRPITATQGGTMDDATRRSLATRVGLDPESATEDEINAKISELTASAAGGEGAGGEGGEGGEGNEGNGSGEGAGEGAGGEAEPTTPPATQAGAVLVDAEELDRLRAGASAGVEERQLRLQREDNELLDSAVRAGRFSPARREHYAALLQADREGTRQMIAGLADNVVPVQERGAQGNGAEGGANDGSAEAFVELFPEINKIRAGNVPGRQLHGRVMKAQEA